MRTGDVFRDIQARVRPEDYDLSRAEGRADFDDALRAELASIEDKIVRAHASEMIREWRHTLFFGRSGTFREIHAIRERKD